MKGQGPAIRANETLSDNLVLSHKNWLQNLGWAEPTCGTVILSHLHPQGERENVKVQNIVRPDLATARPSKLGCQLKEKITISRIQELKKAYIGPILAIPL